MSPHAAPLADILPANTVSGGGCKIVNESARGTHRAEARNRRRAGCDHHEMSDDRYNRNARGELPLQRLDRTYSEIIQEVRVAQTGVQVMLAFVLTLAFTPRFAFLTTGQLRLYVATLVLGAVAASFLMAPAAFNRLVFRRRLRRQLVSAANQFYLFGLGFLLASLGCAIMLILQVVIGSGILAAAFASVVVLWFAFMWFAIPAWMRYRHRECGPSSHAPVAEVTSIESPAHEDSGTHIHAGTHIHPAAAIVSNMRGHTLWAAARK
jgi:hypothetical protein